MFGQNSADGVALFGRHIDQEQILRGSQPHLRFKLFDRLAQPRLESISASVLDTAVFDEQAEKIISVCLAMPAEQIALFGKLKGAGGLQLETGALFNFGPAPISATFFQHI